MPASGIGLAMARRFAAEGMKLVLGDVEAPALEAAVASFPEATEVTSLVCDVSDRAQVEALRDAAASAFGTAHLVCNNAGVGSGGAIDSVALADWEWVLGVNLWGVIHGVRTFLPLLTEQGEGHIVNTASAAGLFAAPVHGPLQRVQVRGRRPLRDALPRAGDVRLAGRASRCCARRG